jgi:hypothetical protein
MEGTAADLPPLAVEVALMTGNVAQVFLDDSGWAATLAHIRSALQPDGRLVFETRDPDRRAWEEWTTDRTRSVVDIAGVGRVESSVELVDVSLPLVSFRWTFRFHADGAALTSDSTLRFRGKDELVESLHVAGYVVNAIRDAPDRPGREFAFVTSRVG